MWQLNCFKKFIFELCNQKEAIELIEVDYSHTHNYYGLLYSFYLKNEDYRKAAASCF